MTFNVNGPKIQLKIKIVGSNKKQKSTICHLHETYLIYKYTESLKIKAWTKE